MNKMVQVAIFRKGRKVPTNRTLITIERGKTTKKVIQNIKRAGVLSRGKFVAFRVSKNKKRQRI